MHTSKFFKAARIADGVTSIAGLGGEVCYLVTGSERALLIDTLTGVGNLKAFCMELTDLPITVVNTHGHVDHCGGNFDFGACRIHPADIELMYEHGAVEQRFGFVSGMQATAEEPVAIDRSMLPEPCAVKTLPVYDGDVFDLGGRRIEVIGVPGHTFGTIVLLDRDLRIVFSGDACNVNTLLFLPHSTSIEEYRESLLHFRSFLPAFDGLYGGHGPGPVPVRIIDEAITLCEEILARTDDAVASQFIGRDCLYGKKAEMFRRLDGKLANIAYSLDNLVKPERMKVIAGM